MSFTIGSLFDGSGGFPLAATMSGGTPTWASEIEPYPIAVTKSRFPNVKHLGSVTDIDGGKVDPVDVITFGSPCQDLSVAGKRAGLKHEANGDDETTRSGLFMEAVRIIKEMREATNGRYPTFALWENVPGAFSSNNGEDFRIVLQELIQIAEPTAVMPEVPKNGWAYADSYCGDGWSIAYRVLDAQHWGVPQRRRRIYLVADFRGERARKVLFEREGLRGYFETGRTPWQTATGDAEGSVGTADCKSECVLYSRGYGGKVTTDGVSPTLEARAGTGGNNQPIVAYGIEPGIAAREGGHIYEGVSGTLRANAGDNQMSVAYSINHQGGNVEQILADKTGTLTAAMNSSGNNKLSVAYSFDALSSNSMKSSNPHSGCRQVDVAKCLDTTDPNPCKNQGGIAVVEAIGFDGYNSTETGDKAATLGVNCGMSTGRNGIVEAMGVDRYNQCSTGEVSETLRTPGGGDNFPTVCYTMKIRSGCEGGGKGALIQEDKSATLATNNDHYLFQPIAYEWHSQDLRVREIEDDIAPTLPAAMGMGGANMTSPMLIQEPVAFPAVGVDVYNQTLTGDKAKTLNSAASDADHVPCAVYSIENHPADSRVNIDDSGKVQTLTSRMGTGGGNVPMVMESQPVVYDRATVTSPINASNPQPGDPCHTLSTYSLETFHCISEEEKTTTLKARDYKDPICVTVPCFWDGSQTVSTLTANNANGAQRMPDKENFNCIVEQIPIAIDRAAFNQGQNALYDPQYYTDGTAPTLIARGPGGVAYQQEVRYIVRRLTPTECARLQGFPDAWGHPDAKVELTDEEYQFWLKVRNLHAAINDKPTKEYTKEQILKWYNGLHTDSSEYKMWGNGIALPNALYVMQGIAEVMSEEKDARKKWLYDLLK